ncbi:MAG: hypothetical protein H0V00_09070 [Chloroflexia bacterium]|nr:hypothetical protein [Chloroflexia bacterium]
MIGLLTAGSPAERAAAQQVSTPVANPAPLHLLASGEGPPPGVGAELVWLVQRGAVSGARRTEASAFPLGFALAQRGTLDILDGNGTRLATLDPGQASFLPSGMAGVLASASGDLTLYAQIALVPVATLPDALPPQTVTSTSFPSPDADTIHLELVRGLLNPGRAAVVAATAPPALLLASDNPIQIETAGAEPVDIVRDDFMLLQAAATVRNRGTQPATFVVARVIPSLAAEGTSRGTETAALTTQPSDPELDAAWRRFGCHLNPGNPSCLTVGVAADCALDPTDAGCAIDSDGDRCRDVAEVRAGFDAFDGADCVSSGQGEPALNCLFLSEDIACDGGRDATGECTRFDRDPRCDGFAPYGG